MISRITSAIFGLLLGLVLVPPGAAEAQQMDAVVTTSQTEPAKVEPGTVQVSVTAIIRESIGVEFTAPLTLDGPKKLGQGAAANLVLANTTRELDGQEDLNTELSAMIAIRGKPNQTFAISVARTTRLHGAKRNSGVAIVTHDAGLTPRVGPEGETEFVITAKINLAQNMPVSNYKGMLEIIVSGMLDVVVSHN